MTKSRDNPRSTSPENFQRLYDGLSIADKALIAAWMNMNFAILQSFSKAQKNGNKKGA